MYRLWMDGMYMYKIRMDDMYKIWMDDMYKIRMGDMLMYKI